LQIRRRRAPEPKQGLTSPYFADRIFEAT